MKTVGLVFKNNEKVETVENHVENTEKTPKKPVKKASLEIEPEGDE